MADTSRPALNQLDAELAKLRAEHPGWNIWYVPHADGTVIWCAQPLPLINCSSTAELGEYIEKAEAKRSQALYGPV